LVTNKAGSQGEQKLEPVRLVIWDLDGTFWRGNFTEGGIAYRQDCHEIIVELARRGIMSSICSNNDPAAIRPVLEAHDIWRYFIFPSIGWAPKGQRIAALIETVQLRPASVMFIDDHPMNLAEAIFYVPALQTESDDFIQNLLGDPRFQGRNDQGLTRLAQYKLLETRQAHKEATQSDNLAFLRGSGIEVMIEHDVEAHIDRAVELINRTNQLNFTKIRLPEDISAAREQLRASIRRYDAYSGLVRVRDRYGDYGLVGLFVSHGAFGAAALQHFCFSCRILGMGVETWLYRRLGRPRLRLAKEVMRDITAETQEIDWISITTDAQAAPRGPGKLLDRLVLRGGCDLEALSHYLAPLTEAFAAEMPTARHNRSLRLDSSAFLNLVFGNVSEVAAAALQRVGFLPRDWQSALSKPRGAGDKIVWIFSFWLDSFINFYRHRDLDITVPFFLEASNNHFWCDVTKLDEDTAFKFLAGDANRNAYRALKQEFVGIGQLTETRLAAAIADIEHAAAGNVLVFIMLAPDLRSDPQTGAWVARPPVASMNGWIRNAAAGRPDFHLVNMLDFVEPGTALPDDFHFNRLVYKQAAAHIEAIIEGCFGAGVKDADYASAESGAAISSSPLPSASTP
jgi:FkbH-like protein